MFRDSFFHSSSSSSTVYTSSLSLPRLSTAIRSDNRFIQGDLVNKWIASSHIGQLKFDKRNSLIKDIRQKRRAMERRRVSANKLDRNEYSLYRWRGIVERISKASLVEIETTVKQLNTWSIDEISTKYKAKRVGERRNELLLSLTSLRRRRRRGRSNDEWLYLHSIKAHFFFRVNHRFK